MNENRRRRGVISAGLLASLVCGSAALGAGGAAVHWYHARDAALVNQGTALERVRVLDSTLVAERGRVVVADTVRVTALRRLLVRDTLWQRDTLRVAVLARPDSAVVSVAEYRRLARTDSARYDAAAAVIVADSVDLGHTRALLLTTDRKLAELERARPPVIFRPSRLHRWRDGAEHVLLASALVALVRS